ncbi:MAG: Hpt domain-containing protein, partial [Acidobacteriota bacterium]
MKGTDVELSRQVERIPPIGNRSALECAGKSALCEVRLAAEAIAGMSGDICGNGPPTAEAEKRFQSALLSLREALEGERPREADQELMQEFLVEAREHLADAEEDLLTLEQEPGNAEALHGVFRSFHTVKGLAGFLGATAIEELTHETENILDLARSGQLALTPEMTDLILRSADAVNLRLDLARILPLHALPRCDAGLLAALAQASAGGAGALALAPPSRAPVPGFTQRHTGGRSLRIESANLEYLIDMVGQLVIAESAVRHDLATARPEDSLLSGSLTRLTQAVAEVRRASLSMRLAPVGVLFRRMRRLIRDLARKQGKPIDLLTLGDDVELDRGMVEALADPMVHM